MQPEKTGIAKAGLKKDATAPFRFRNIEANDPPPSVTSSFWEHHAQRGVEKAVPALFGYVNVTVLLALDNRNIPASLEHPQGSADIPRSPTFVHLERKRAEGDTTTTAELCRKEARAMLDILKERKGKGVAVDV